MKRRENTVPDGAAEIPGQESLSGFLHLFPMTRRPGLISVTLLLTLSAVSALAAAVLLFVSRSGERLDRYEKGLASAYAAESGANWALGSLKSGVRGDRSASFSVGDCPVQVSVTDIPEEGGEGVIASAGSDAYGEFQRYVRITYTYEEGQLIVQDVRTEDPRRF